MRLVLIIFLATILRLYQLGNVPPGLDWDEASLGWNAYSIYKTGGDEYGKPLPVSLRSFNDYKPALYAYAAMPSIAIFGLSEFSVRLPSALAGILLVPLVFFLCRKIKLKLLPCYLATLLVAISPWAIQFSRVAFEANLAAFFFVLGAYFLVKFLSRPSPVSCILSLVSFILSIYSYHSPRIVIPLFLLGTTVWYRKVFLSHWRLCLLSFIFCLILLYPLARNAWHTGGLVARYQTVAAKLDPAVITKNYLSHFDPNFLFVSGDRLDRHHAPDVGLLYITELPFFLTGLYFLVKERPKFLPFLAVWFFAAPAAASLANDAPHAVRSLLFLPVFQIMIAYGFIKIPKKLFVVYCLLFVANIFYYLHQYFVHLPIEYASSWQYGYKQMVQKVLALENNYDRIYVTPAYDQPYIYFLFYGRVSPIIKNNGYFYSGFDKYEFSLAKTDPRGLYIISPQDKVSGFFPFDQVNFPDNTPAFYLGAIK